MENFFLGFLFCLFLVGSINLNFGNFVILIIGVLVKFKIESLGIILIVFCFLYNMYNFFLVKITNYIYFDFWIWIFNASYFKEIEIFTFGTTQFFLLILLLISYRIFIFLIIVRIILSEICVLLLIVHVRKFH